MSYWSAPFLKLQLLPLNALWKLCNLFSADIFFRDPKTHTPIGPSRFHKRNVYKKLLTSVKVKGSSMNFVESGDKLSNAFNSWESSLAMSYIYSVNMRLTLKSTRWQFACCYKQSTRTKGCRRKSWLHTYLKQFYYQMCFSTFLSVLNFHIDNDWSNLAKSNQSLSSYRKFVSSLYVNTCAVIDGPRKTVGETK